MTRQLREAEAALRAARRRFQATLDHAPVMVVEKDLDGRYTFVNRAFLETIGATADAVLGKTAYDILPPDHADLQTRLAHQAVAENSPIQREMTLPTVNGLKSMLVIEFPLKDSDGSIKAVGSIAADVTELKEAEGQLAHAQKMDAIGQLTGGIAHDFNNLLTAIQLNADVLAARIQDPALQSIAESMRMAAACGAELTNGLLAFGRRQMLEARPTDIADLVNKWEKLLSRTLGQHIQIRQIMADDLWPARVDDGQLEAAVLNLALNARDAMAAGGTLTIETRNVFLDVEDARLNDVQPGAYVMIAVGDNGIGMTRETMARAFEPFYTTKDVGKGTGLGLSMVYGFAKQSGGLAKIHSQPGAGTVVKLYLPRSEDEPTDAIISPAVEDDLPAGKETILMVEDDELVRLHTTDLLVSLGYCVTAVENAAAALAVLEHAPMPDLLFTDIMMPGGTNGCELTRLLRKRWPQLAVLLMSGYPGSPALAGMDIQGVHMLGKPFRRGAIAVKIREALDARARQPVAAEPTRSVA